MIARDTHADTRRLADALAAVPLGQPISRAALSVVIGRDVNRSTSTLYSAFRIAERESGAVFACEIGKGYRRLTAEEIPNVGTTARAQIRRKARRTVRTLSAGVAGVNSLPPDTARRILAEQSVLGMIEHMARDKSLPPIGEAETRPLPVAVAAREFLRAIGG